MPGWAAGPIETTAPDVRARVHRWSERADELAVRHSAAPGSALAVLLAVSVAILAVAIPGGLIVHDDPALWLREGAPGTWLSAAMLAAAAVAARAAFRREEGRPRWHHSFWGLSALVIAGLATVELAQPTVFLADWLEERLGLGAPLGIQNLDAALLVILLIGITIALVPRMPVLRRHPMTALLLCVAGACAVTSQGLDAALPVSNWEFVAEDGIKALGQPFLIAGYLFALRDLANK